jgi:hypothetical protein
LGISGIDPPKPEPLRELSAILPPPSRHTLS